MTDPLVHQNLTKSSSKVLLTALIEHCTVALPVSFCGDGEVSRDTLLSSVARDISATRDLANDILLCSCATLRKLLLRAPHSSSLSDFLDAGRRNAFGWSNLALGDTLFLPSHIRKWKT